MKRGKFITIEGGEGVGKSTQIASVREFLASRGIDVVVTREPGGTPRAERIRELLLARDDEPMSTACELLLVFAARATHVSNLIEPALRRGAWVVCDRFLDATFAYQGAGRGVDSRSIEQLASFVLGDLSPDLTLLLDAPLDLAAGRAAKRNALRGGSDRFEQEKRDFFERVRAGYLESARRAPERIVVIDASGSKDEVQTSICGALESRLLSCS